ncbi:MAG: hypothetical protein WC525_02295 [Candidatus Thermoplasmatota archaeon]
MPLDVVDAGKLIVGIVLLIIPGYLWSFLFSKTITYIERVVFGFLIGVILFSVAPYVFNAFFSVALSSDVILLCYFLYLVPAILFFFILWYRSGKPELRIPVFITWKNLLLLCLIGFIVFMTFLPHLSMDYYLPFHVDEWVHWSYSRAIMDAGSVSFPNPYIGGSSPINPEVGFHTFTASLCWWTSCSLLTIFLVMPSIFMLFLGLTAFCIGQRSEKKFGYEALLLISFIPTTTRYLGPSFYVAVGIGLMLLLFIIWLFQQENLILSFLVTPVIWCLSLIHPATAFAGIIVTSVYSLMFLVERKLKTAIITGSTVILACLSLLILLFIPSRWSYAINVFLSSIAGEQYTLGLPMIFLDFHELGIITWVLFVIGAYYVITRGKSLQYALYLNAVVFIMIIGLFSVFGFGIPIVYERSFLYLFLFVSLIAAFSLRELRSILALMMMKYVPRKLPRFNRQTAHLVIAVVVTIILLFTVVPKHLSTPYYKMIKEEEYDSFIWIRENIDDYRDANHTYLVGAVHPYKASPFSAVTGLNIVTSSMHPLIRYDLQDDMQSFLADRARNTSFLVKYKISVVYGSCDNQNLTMVHPNVYLYTGNYSQ